MRAKPPAEIETENLVGKAQAGDGRAAEALLLRFRPLIAATIGQHSEETARDETAEELWQEAYRQFLELLRDYRQTERAGFGPYVKQMLAWRVANFIRAERRRQRLSAPLEPSHLDAVWEEMRPSLGLSLENPRLRAATKKLSPRQRSVLFNWYWREKTAAEIAMSEGMSIQAVTSLRRRAEGRLRKVMNDETSCTSSEEQE